MSSSLPRTDRVNHAIFTDTGIYIYIRCNINDKVQTYNILHFNLRCTFTSRLQREPTETDKINQLTNSYVPKKDVPEEKEP